MFTIGEASRLSGVTVETIRYYERRGLITEPGRSASGRRLFSDDEVAELRFIRRCRDMGICMDGIEDILVAVRRGEGECACVSRVGHRHLEKIRNNIRELQALEKMLLELLAPCGPEAGDGCELLDKMLRDPLTEAPAGLP